MVPESGMSYRAGANTMDSLPGECRVSPSMERVKISPDWRWSTEKIFQRFGATSCRIWGRANISRQKYCGLPARRTVSGECRMPGKPVDFIR